MRLLGILFLSLSVLISCQRTDFYFTDGSGATFNGYKDEILFVNIWADWCPPCIIEFKYFNEINEKDDVSVVGYHFDQFDSLQDEEVNKLIEKFGITFLNLKNDPRDIWGIELPENVPTTYVIKNNEVIEIITTPITLEDLENTTFNLLNF